MKLFKTIETNFAAFDDTVKTYLSKALGAIGERYSKTQIFGVIFEGIKGVMQNIMVYIEDAFTEQNIETAFRKTSVYSLAKLSGYEPFYGSAATGILNIKVTAGDSLPDNATKLYIKNKSILLNNINGLFYTINIPTDYYIVDINKPLSAYQVKIIQGTWKSASYASNGGALESIHINTSGIFDREYITVFVDGIEYTRVSNLYEMTENGLEYFVTIGYENEFDVIFGNGIYGKQLDENQIVTINYISHNGEEGNISVSDKTNFVLQTVVYDEYGETVKTNDLLTYSISTPISGGSNSETIETVREMIGYNSRSLVLANENNFKLFLKRFSFIGQSNIWCDVNSLTVNAVCLANYNKNNFSYLDYFNACNENKLLLSKNQKEMVVTALNNSKKTFAGITFNFIDPIFYKYGIIAYVKIDKQYDKDIAKAEISKLIAEYFVNLKSNTTFIAKSDIIQLITNNISYIDSFDFTFISDMDERGKSTGVYEKYKKVEDKYFKTTEQYTTNVGLDIFGNISIDDKFVIPVISNNIHYHVESGAALSNLPAIQVFFI